MLIVTLVLILILRYLPWTISLAVLGLSLLCVAGLLSVAGIDRAIAPLLIYALGLGLLVPVSMYAKRTVRVAPRRKRNLKQDAANDKNAAQTHPSNHLIYPDTKY